MKYKIYYLTCLIQTTNDRESALEYVAAECAATGKDRDDFEILDTSDLVTS
jgi:hypothetical protein